MSDWLPVSNAVGWGEPGGECMVLIGRHFYVPPPIPLPRHVRATMGRKRVRFVCRCGSECMVKLAAIDGRLLVDVNAAAWAREHGKRCATKAAERGGR